MMLKTTSRLAIAAAVWSAVAFFTIAVGDGRGGFWTNHPMLGALVAGALLFLLGAFVANEVLERRAAMRWSRVAKVGFTGLALQTRDALAHLWGVHSGPGLGGEHRAIHFDLTPARELKHDLPGKARVAVFKDPALPHWDLGDEDVIPWKRLDVLLRDPGWLEFARENILDRYQRTQAATKE